MKYIFLGKVTPFVRPFWVLSTLTITMILQNISRTGFCISAVMDQLPVYKGTRAKVKISS